MSIENVDGLHDPLVIRNSGEVEANLLGGEAEVSLVSAERVVGVQAVIRTTEIGHNPDAQWDGADAPLFRGRRVKAANLPVIHSRLS